MQTTSTALVHNPPLTMPHTSTSRPITCIYNYIYIYKYIYTLPLPTLDHLYLYIYIYIPSYVTPTTHTTHHTPSR